MPPLTGGRSDHAGLPSPIAVVYQDMLDEEHVQLKLRKALQTFSVAVRYLALVAINDYLSKHLAARRVRDAALPPALPRAFAEMSRLLIENIERPSLGHWNHFLREYLKSFPRDAIFMPELFDFYFRDKNLKPSAAAALIDDLIAVRNEIVHPDIYPAEGLAVALLATTRERLDRLLAAMSFLDRYQLVRTERATGAECVCRGPAVPPLGRGAGTVSFSVRRIASGESLSLGNFVHYEGSIGDDTHHTLLYETRKGRRIKYILGNYYTIYKSAARREDRAEGDPVRIMDNLLADLAEILEQPAEKRAAIPLEPGDQLARGFLDWATLRGLTDLLISKGVLARFNREDKYRHGLYVERAQVNQALRQLIDPADPARERSALVVVAESGIGKTNLLCRWAESLSASGNAVMFFHGRTCEGGGIDDLILSHLRLEPIFAKLFTEDDFGSFLELLDRQRPAGACAVVMIDAVNEAASPEALLDEIFAFVERYAGHPWLKVICTVRTFVWETLKDRYSLGANRFVHGQDAAGRPQPFVSLGKFSGDELREAYDKYRRQFGLRTPCDALPPGAEKLLDNPLMLRLAAETFRERELPARLYGESVFESYYERRVDEKDRHFLAYLVEAMWRLKTDKLPFAAFDRTALGERTPALATPPLAAGPASLAEKIREYVYADPEYELQEIPVCGNPGCLRFDQEPSALTISPAAADGEDLPRCSQCGSPLARKKPVDRRTTYYRLQSRNIIQEFTPDGQDSFVCFTYDKMFEFLVARFLADRHLEGLPRRGPRDLVAVLREIGTAFIFWGAVRSVVVSRLRESGGAVARWRGLFAVEPDLEGLPDEERSFLKAALKAILTSALVDLAAEKPGETARLLEGITAAGDPGAAAMGIALAATFEIAAGRQEGDLEPGERVVFERGLVHRDKQVRLAAARAALALFARNPALVIELMSRLRDQLVAALAFPRILALASEDAREDLARRIDSLANLAILVLGAHYADDRARNGVVGVGRGIIDAVSRKTLVRLFKSRLIAIVAKKLASIYWEKGPFVCNYLEMYLYQQSSLRGEASGVGDLFRSAGNADLDEQELERLCRLENGLMTWYLYSLLPLLAQRKDISVRVIALLERLSAEGNVPAQYVANKALWILAEFSDLGAELTERPFLESSRRMLERHGMWMPFRHTCARDAVVTKYLEERRNGERLRYWAEHSGGVLTLRYDSAVLLALVEYELRRRPAARIDLVIGLLETGRWRGDDEFLMYCIEVLGGAGQRHPGPALKTLQYLIERLVDWDRRVLYRGRETTPQEVLTRSLVAIKGNAPGQVSRFVGTLEPADARRLQGVLLADTEVTTELSYFGEYVYQKSFLTQPAIRDCFGQGIRDADRAASVTGLFSAFLARFVDRFGTGEAG